jgi:hypothetical protein
MKPMPQFQPQVPHPLTDDLPPLLSSGRVTTPAIGILFQVFIAQRIFKGSTMEIQRHHIGSAESVLRQLGEEQFVDDAVPLDADRLFVGPAGWVATTTRQRVPDEPMGTSLQS